MEVPIGLTPEEMLSVFNRMYFEVWEEKRQQIDWEAANLSKRLAAGEEVDISAFLIRVLEVVVQAARDGTVLTLYENNHRLYEDLKRAGLDLPDPEAMPPVD